MHAVVLAFFAPPMALTFTYVYIYIYIVCISMYINFLAHTHTCTHTHTLSPHALMPARIWLALAPLVLGFQTAFYAVSVNTVRAPDAGDYSLHDVRAYVRGLARFRSHTHTHIHTDMHTYIHTYIHTHTCTHTHIHTHHVSGVQVPVSAIALAACWPVAMVAVQELVKSNQHKHFNRQQKRAKIVFGTKLGMHSPV
jgi:hypothetical protein